MRFLANESIEDARIRNGIDLLSPGMLYTVDNLAFVVVRHFSNCKPRLKLKLYPARFVRAMAEMQAAKQ